MSDKVTVYLPAGSTRGALDWDAAVDWDAALDWNAIYPTVGTVVTVPSNSVTVYLPLATASVAETAEG